METIAKTPADDATLADGGETREFRYHPRHEPVPAGWAIVDDFRGCHHGQHAVLIQKL